jgi:uridine phosphorylase
MDEVRFARRHSLPGNHKQLVMTSASNVASSAKGNAPASAVPLLANKDHAAPTVFTPENLLREARRQKGLSPAPVPSVCVLDPDGDLGRTLLHESRARRSPDWACYHTDLLVFEHAGRAMGLVRCAVGASFAVLVAEELFAAGCQLLVSMTSAGRIAGAFGAPPYFVLIEEAWRDEGTSYHYLPPSERAALAPDLRRRLHGAFAGTSMPVHAGSSWTTDAPFRETAAAIEFYRGQGVAAVEMEAAALYAFAQARGRAVVCLAHVTNQMAVVENDFEKGRDHGSHDALEVISRVAQALGDARPAHPELTNRASP